MTAHYKISFRVRHPSHDPKDICDRLRLSPDRLWKSGEPRTTPKGELLEGLNLESFVAHRLPDSPTASLADSIVDFLKHLRPHRAFLDEISDSGGSLSFFVGLFLDGNDHGETLRWDFLNSVTCLRISLELCIYSAEESIGVRREESIGSDTID